MGLRCPPIFRMANLHGTIMSAKPDVVITDISMPRMDGMELISNIRKQDKYTRVVVLSCLEEFELARKALTLDVSSYILKLTMTEEEIEQVLTGVREELDQQHNSTHVQARAAAASPDMELVKEKMFKDFMFYRIFHPKNSPVSLQTAAFGSRLFAWSFA